MGDNNFRNATNFFRSSWSSSLHIIFVGKLSLIWRLQAKAMWLGKDVRWIEQTFRSKAHTFPQRWSHKLIVLFTAQRNILQIFYTEQGQDGREKFRKWFRKHVFVGPLKQAVEMVGVEDVVVVKWCFAVKEIYYKYHSRLGKKGKGEINRLFSWTFDHFWSV